MSDTQASLPELAEPIRRVLAEAKMPETVARLAIANHFKDKPVELIARALYTAANYGLDPVLGHVVVFKPRGADEYATVLTRDARLLLASRQVTPDGQKVLDGIVTDDPIVEGDEVRIKCTVWRKDMRREAAVTWGRCKTSGKRSAQKGGGTYTVEWAEEIARARAIRNALRIAFPELPGDPRAEAAYDDQQLGVDFEVDAETGEVIDQPAPVDDPAEQAQEAGAQL